MLTVCGRIFLMRAPFSRETMQTGNRSPPPLGAAAASPAVSFITCGRKEGRYRRYLDTRFKLQKIHLQVTQDSDSSFTGYAFKLHEMHDFALKSHKKHVRGTEVAGTLQATEDHNQVTQESLSYRRPR